MNSVVTPEYHEPVLPDKVAELLVTDSGIYVDGTLGGGGHSYLLCETLLKSGLGKDSLLVGIDQDSHALEAAHRRLEQYAGMVVLVRGNFSNIRDIVSGIRSRDDKERPVMGILLDLGVSSFQIDAPFRGFSYMKDGPLDMRMNPDGAVTAADVINGCDEAGLARLFHCYGEEPMSRRIAKAVVSFRALNGAVRTTGELSAIVRSVHGRPDLVIKTLSRVYQALRIEVNDELGVLKKVLADGLATLSGGGRMAVISYHSLEDRIVKQFFSVQSTADWGPKGVALREPLHGAAVRLITKKPIVASADETVRNPRSRSAKMRVIEKL